MLAQFDHVLLQSFILWFENQLEKDGVKAFKNVDSQFKYVDTGDTPSGYVAFQSEFRQIVASGDIASPVSQVVVDGLPYDIGSANDIYLDYNNGRIFLPDYTPTTSVVTANLPVREINVYPTAQEDEQMILTYDFKQKNGRQFLYSKDDKLDEIIFALPACFVTLVDSDNKEHSFGGNELTTSHIRISVLSNDKYVLDGTLSLLRDSVRKIFKHVPFDSYPYGFMNSLKTPPYSYSSLVSSLPDSFGTSSCIEKAQVSKITKEKIVSKLGNSNMLGFVDLEIQTSRYPRSN